MELLQLQKEGVIIHDHDKEKGLNIEHRFVSIGGCENHDKEQFQRYQYRCGSSDLQVGWLSKSSIVVRDVIG